MIEHDASWRLPAHHPLVSECSRRASIVEQERLLRQCLVATLEQRVDGLKFRPSEPQELAAVPADNFCMGSSASGSFYNTPTTSNLASPNVRRESGSDAHDKLLDTGDIELYLKQMQKKHHDDFRRRNAFVKVNYHRSKSSVVQSYMDRKVREEEEIRNDIEIVEGLMLSQLLEAFRAHRYSKLMGMQLEEKMLRARLMILEVENLHDLLLKLRAATDSWEVSMITHVATHSPQRGWASPSRTPARPPSSTNLRSAPSSARLCRGRSASTAADIDWVESYLGGNETRLRMELESERDALMERLELCAVAEKSAMHKGYLGMSANEGLALKNDVPENEARRYIRAMCLFLGDEEELLRYQLEVLCDQGLRRLRMVCNSTVFEVDLSKVGSFIRTPSFARAASMRASHERKH